MNAKFIAYSKSALHTFFFLAGTYLLLSLYYVYGILPVGAEELRIAYFFGIWLCLPAAITMVVLVLPLIALGEFLVNRFNLSRKWPMIFIFPVGLILPPISFIIAPVILIPVVLIVMFVYPFSGNKSSWGYLESAIFSFNLSYAFIIFWQFLGKYTRRLNEPSEDAFRVGTSTSSPRH